MYMFTRCCFTICLFFFFQAEDGIRDWSVTGVQTCALPIFQKLDVSWGHEPGRRLQSGTGFQPVSPEKAGCLYHFLRFMESATRSEERRVGKECRSRWSPYH